MKNYNFGLLGLKISCVIVLLASIFTMIYGSVIHYNNTHDIFGLVALIIVLLVVLWYETNTVINIVKIK